MSLKKKNSAIKEEVTANIRLSKYTFSDTAKAWADLGLCSVTAKKVVMMHAVDLAAKIVKLKEVLSSNQNEYDFRITLNHYKSCKKKYKEYKWIVENYDLFLKIKYKN